MWGMRDRRGVTLATATARTMLAYAPPLVHVVDRLTRRVKASSGLTIHSGPIKTAQWLARDAKESAIDASAQEQELLAELQELEQKQQKSVRKQKAKAESGEDVKKADQLSEAEEAELKEVRRGEECSLRKAADFVHCLCAPP